MLSGTIARSRQDAGWDVPWGVALASFHPSPQATAERQAAVVTGQREVMATVSGVFQGPATDSFRTRGWLSDTVHFNARVSPRMRKPGRKHWRAHEKSIETQTMKPTQVFLTTLRLAPLVALHAADIQKPNVVILLADDLRPDGLATLGNPVVKTPNLDEPLNRKETE